jgi:lia operon protein LiaG
MKINIKKIVIILLATTVITYSIGFLIIRFTGGGSFNINKQSFDKQISKNFIEQIFSFNIDKQSHNINKNKTSKLQGVKEIDIEAAAASVNIIPEAAEGNGVKAHLYGSTTDSSNNEPELECYISNNILYVNEKRNSKFAINIGNGEQNLKLDVYVPASYSEDMKLDVAVGELNLNNFKLNNLDCDLSVGKAKLNNINAKTFDYKNSTGDLEAVGLHTEKSSLKASIGKINVSDFTGDLNAENSTGNIDVKYATFDNNVDIKASIGRIQLQLPSKAQFYIDADASFGEITCDFPVTVIENKKHGTLQGTVINNKNKVKLNVSTGNIDVSSYD